MKYEKIYYKLILKFLDQCIEEGEYTERHHIIPKYIGGEDEPYNLIRVTFKQHRVLHGVWFKITGDKEARAAWLMMRGKTAEGRRLIASLGGQKNADSGFLDKIRPLANTKVQREKLDRLNRIQKENGHMERIIKLAAKANTGRVPTEEYLQYKSKQMKEFHKNNPWLSEINKKNFSKYREERVCKSKEDSLEVLRSGERDESLLSRECSLSKNIFISPEGLEFSSLRFICQFYGQDDKRYKIDNWCKRGQNGWSRKSKTGEI